MRGFQVAPSELERCLLDYITVADACVVGILDKYTVDLLFAYIVLSADAARTLETAGDPVKAQEDESVDYWGLYFIVFFFEEIEITVLGVSGGPQDGQWGDSDFLSTRKVWLESPLIQIIVGQWCSL